MEEGCALTLPKTYATMVVGPAVGPAILIQPRGTRAIEMTVPAFDHLDREPCDRRWTVSGCVAASRVAGLLRLLDDSFSLPGVQLIGLYA